MFPKLSKSVLKIGQENISVVQNKIKQLGIRHTAKDVGGEMGRKIRFELSTGRVIVQKRAREA
jgi:chemotaxis receptor (MCP) glutamine deamidase CheD